MAEGRGLREKRPSERGSRVQGRERKKKRARERQRARERERERDRERERERESAPEVELAAVDEQGPLHVLLQHPPRPPRVAHLPSRKAPLTSLIDHPTRDVIIGT